MPVAVVVLLEEVHVDHHESEGVAGPSRPADFAFEGRVEPSPVASFVSASSMLAIRSLLLTISSSDVRSTTRISRLS